MGMNIVMDVWVNPLDEKEYFEGDIIPAYIFDNSGALVFGEPCVRLNDPGFPGVVVVKHGNHIAEIEYSIDLPLESILEWRLEAIEPDDSVYYIGPESPGWRWFYARRSTLSSRAMSMGSGEDMIA